VIANLGYKMATSASSFDGFSAMGTGVRPCTPIGGGLLAVCGENVSYTEPGRASGWVSSDSLIRTNDGIGAPFLGETINAEEVKPVPVTQHRAPFDRVFFDDDRVFLNMLDKELRYMPRPNYFNTAFDSHPEIKPFMRKMVVDWMLDVCEEQCCDDDVFALAVNYLDRFLSTSETPVARNQLQLLGAVAMFIAVKLKESDKSSLTGEKLVIYTANSITLQQLFSWELIMLSRLRWDMAAITPVDFLDQLLWRLTIPMTNVHRVRHVALCVSLLTFGDHKFSVCPPSLIASASIVFAFSFLRSTEPTLTLPQPNSSQFPYQLQWAFTDTRQSESLTETNLFEQLQDVTAIDADCLRQWYDHITNLVYTADNQQTLLRMKGGLACWACQPPSPAATPTDVLDVANIIEGQ